MGVWVRGPWHEQARNRKQATGRDNLNGLISQTSLIISSVTGEVTFPRHSISSKRITGHSLFSSFSTAFYFIPGFRAVGWETQL